MSSRIAVIVPTYNGQRLIRRALDSVASQTCPPSELIVIDDCSNDATVEVCQSWKEAHRPPFQVRVLQLDQNSGSPASPINYGVEATDAEFVTVLEQDDTFQPCKLELALAVFNDVPEIVFLTHSGSSDSDKLAASISQRNFHRDRGLNRELTVSGFEIAKLPKDEATLMCLRHSMYPAGFPGIVFRRSAWQAAGKCSTQYKIVNDFAFLLSLS